MRIISRTMHHSLFLFLVAQQLFSLFWLLCCNFSFLITVCYLFLGTCLLFFVSFWYVLYLLVFGAAYKENYPNKWRVKDNIKESGQKVTFCWGDQQHIRLCLQSIHSLHYSFPANTRPIFIWNPRATCILTPKQRHREREGGEPKLENPIYA